MLSISNKNQSYKLKLKIFNFVLSFCILIFGSWACVYAQDAEKGEEAIFVAKKALDDGFYEVSLGLLERFLKTYPDSPKIPEANLLIGQCYFHQNKFLDALGKFEALLNQPAAGDIKDACLYWIAEVHFKGNSFSKAAEYYRMVVESFPKSPYAISAYYSLGWCLFQDDNFNDALRYFKIVEEKFPKESQAQDSSFKIIECLYNLKSYIALKDKVKFYLDTYPKDKSRIPYIYFYLAEADYYLNNFQEALDEYSSIFQNTSDEKIIALSRLGMGWCYLKLKRYKEAEDTFTEVKSDNLEKASQGILLLARAILMFETKRLSEARDIYDQLLKTNPDPLTMIQAYVGKADALYSMAEYPQAISVYKEAQEKIVKGVTPQELVDKIHYGLSWAFLKEGEFKGAIGEFQKIAQNTDDKIVKISALCQIGDAYQDSGDYKKAQEAYDSILKDYPDTLYSDYVQYQLGCAMLKNSNYDGAIMSFSSLKRNYPQSKLLDDASYALALAYFQRQDYNSSRESLEKFQEEYNDSNLKPQALYLLGTNLYNLGRFNEAIEVFKDIIRAYSRDTELVQKAEYEIADCFYQMGNEKEAVARFKILRSKYPDSKLTAEVMWWLGEYYYRKNDLELASRYFSSLIQDFPKSALIADAYYALGSIRSEESNYPDAVNNFKKVKELDKTDLGGTATIAIADIYVKQNKLELALDTYRDAVKNYPNLLSLIYPKIADLYYKLANYTDALDFYRKSLEVVPVKEIGEIQFKLADTLQMQGKSEEAIEEYLKVTYLYSQDKGLMTKSLLRIAGLYEDKENFKEASSIYQKIISSGTEEAKYAQERLDWIRAHVK
ncbi:MAG: tetratricopeptide repeat protein [Candidatus Omnitrophica bacterium]|nr:tetratricopeptide repeat protein [Candidatus Omnitrophota bacterium]